MPAWYLVKTNWPATVERCPRFAGLGGDVWPLDSARGDARAVHDEMMRSREFVPGANALVCPSRDLASRYYEQVARSFPGVPWLLQIFAMSPRRVPGLDGYDLGSPDGGYSIIESEILTQQRSGAVLTEHGLFPSELALDSFLRSRSPIPGLEDIDSMTRVGIKILQPSTRGP